MSPRRVPAFRGFSRPQKGRRRRQVSWLRGSSRPPRLPGVPEGSASGIRQGTLAAYSCGHSRGFKPRSLFSPASGGTVWSEPYRVFRGVGNDCVDGKLIIAKQSVKSRPLTDLKKRGKGDAPKQQGSPISCSHACLVKKGAVFRNSNWLGKRQRRGSRNRVAAVCSPEEGTS